MQLAVKHTLEVFSTEDGHPGADAPLVFPVRESHTALDGSRQARTALAEIPLLSLVSAGAKAGKPCVPGLAFYLGDKGLLHGATRYHPGMGAG